MVHETRGSHCPACQSTQIATIECLPTRGIISLYRRAGILDVARYFDGIHTIDLKRCAACDLRFYSPPCAGDGSFYEQLQKFAWYYEENKAEYGLARKYIPEECKLLEVGCGSGAFRSWLPPAVDYSGLEINDEAVRQGVSRGHRIFKQAIEDFVATAPHKYDVVCAFQVLEHIPDPKSFINACVQALSPQGTLILSTPAEDSFVSIAANMHLNMPPHHALRWSDLALRNLAARERLSVVDVWHEPLAPYHRELHANVLARYYLELLSLKKVRIIENRLHDRLLGRMMQLRPLRNACAARAAAQFEHSHVGHTVVLIATRS